ncbi:hypothetical protein RDT67_13160 [Serratia fonticola]|uniref:Uncharacterized protein n=1 Tax=Serratia fonticola TaxID=47917 RepID=A0AAJ1YBK5_SERFO|nr:hypothetical protein [Serratia fonticola]MDQ9127383.1 hypothetical protein [Serratia fonticola]
MNRDFFIGTTSVQGSVYHAGILFLNGAGFWVRVNGKLLQTYQRLLKEGKLVEKANPHPEKGPNWKEPKFVTGKKYGIK